MSSPGGYIMAARGKESGKCSKISGMYSCRLLGSVVKLFSGSSCKWTGNDRDGTSQWALTKLLAVSPSLCSPAMNTK